LSRIQIFNRDGYHLCDIAADADRSWLIGKYGRCTFTIPVISDKCRERYLGFGNYVLIEHPSLPAWGGMIDTPRKWGNNKVEVTAYTPEYILNYRVTGYDNLKLTPGSMFIKAIDIANKVDDTRLFRGGPIDETGTPISFELRMDNMYDFIKSKIGDAGYEWIIKPRVEANRLLFEASLYEKFVQTLDFSLVDGVNIEKNDDVLVEDGMIYSVLTGVGKGSSWGERRKFRAEDAESGSLYGYREGKVDVDERGESAVQEYAEKQLKKDKQPKKKFDLSAVDAEDTFRYLDLGNVLHVNMSVCGFLGDKIGTSADIRITGMSFVENKGIVRLICEEYSDDTE